VAENAGPGGTDVNVEELPIAEQVKRVITATGISSLYPPQEEAIKAGALEGANLVLASPTASGKTLITELCAMRHVLEKGGKVLYLTPLRALAAEKYEEFRKYSKLTKKGGRRVRVAISTGDYDSADSRLGRYDVIVVTNEKCDSLLRHRSAWLKRVSLVVVDEFHFLNDRDRGPTLEVTLTRLMETNPDAQFFVLSATIRNAEDVAEWLKARYITTEWRPVELKEGVCEAGRTGISLRRYASQSGELRQKSRGIRETGPLKTGRARPREAEWAPIESRRTDQNT
jgi:helicase